MLKIPQTYLNSILSKAGIEKDLSTITFHFISNSSNNIHFIVDEKELNTVNIISKLCQQLTSTNAHFDFRVGQKVVKLNDARYIFTIENLVQEIKLVSGKENTIMKMQNLSSFIPLTNFKINRLGSIQNRISDYKECFGAENQSDFINNQKLLVIGNFNLFKSIPKEYPACFCSENEKYQIQLEYNSPLLPKICFLKNINLLVRYLEHELNGEHITFNTCIFVGSSRFEHSINIIRNYYNQKRFPRTIFIGNKDNQIDLGNNQIPLRWKWTIPEINYFKNKKYVQHKFLVIQNNELEKTIEEFYQNLKKIEIEHTINLKEILYFVRRLYYDWTLKTDTNFNKLQQILYDFKVALEELFRETFFNIDPDFNYQNYYQSILSKFFEIIEAIKKNNKTEKLKSYNHKISQLISPSFLCNERKTELNQIIKQSCNKIRIKGLENLGKLEFIRQKNLNNPDRNYFSFTANRTKTEIISLAKSNDTNKNYHKIISSIYGNGKIQRLIERLATSNTEYTLLIYEIEKKAFKFHLDKYVEELNHEYSSDDRYEICGIAFNEPFYQYSTFDELIDALASMQKSHKETSFYKIHFSDNTLVKLPSSKSVLKISGTEKLAVRVEDLSEGDEIQIYINPDKETLRTIFELKNPDIINIADELSELWQNCLIEAYQKNIFDEPLYLKLKRNGFSVSEYTFRKYLEKEVSFPRSNADLIIIAKTINDSRLTLDYLRNYFIPKVKKYKGKEIEYGKQFSESINHFIVSEGELSDLFMEWNFKKHEIGEIVSNIPIKKIKDIELQTLKVCDD